MVAALNSGELVMEGIDIPDYQEAYEQVISENEMHIAGLDSESFWVRRQRLMSG